MSLLKLLVLFLFMMLSTVILWVWMFWYKDYEWVIYWSLFLLNFIIVPIFCTRWPFQYLTKRVFWSIYLDNSENILNRTVNIIDRKREEKKGEDLKKKNGFDRLKLIGEWIDGVPKSLKFVAHYVLGKIPLYDLARKTNELNLDPEERSTLVKEEVNSYIEDYSKTDSYKKWFWGCLVLNLITIVCANFI